MVSSCLLAINKTVSAKRLRAKRLKAIYWAVSLVSLVRLECDLAVPQQNGPGKKHQDFHSFETSRANILCGGMRAIFYVLINLVQQLAKCKLADVGCVAMLMSWRKLLEVLTSSQAVRAHENLSPTPSVQRVSFAWGSRILPSNKHSLGVAESCRPTNTFQPPPHVQVKSSQHN